MHNEEIQHFLAIFNINAQRIHGRHYVKIFKLGEKTNSVATYLLVAGLLLKHLQYLPCDESQNVL